MTRPYWLRVLRGLDKFANVLLLLGDEDETISHRVARAQVRGYRWGDWTCRALDLVVPGHCQKVLRCPGQGDDEIPLNAPLEGETDRR